MKSIFVQIAAYRDSELGPTIRDCIAQAKWPENLRFGLCIQDDLNTDYGIDFCDSRFKMHRVHWQESQGVCWARKHTQALYDGEAFTLQLDSHHRFAKHWDALLFEDIERCRSEYPIISTYPGAYNPHTNELQHHSPMKIVANRFGPQGGLKRYPLGYKPRPGNAPIPARFIAAGFLFTKGQFCDDIPYDPEIYFAGEELNVSVRAFTNGYDLFHPQRNIVWHEYTRDPKPKHWHDHAQHQAESTANPGNHVIAQRTAADIKHLDTLFSSTQTSQYGLGKKRSVHDYERFAGLDLSRKLVHYETRLGQDPSSKSEPEWQTANLLALEQAQRIKTWSVTVDFSAISQELESSMTAMISFFDRHEQLAYRTSISPQTAIKTPIQRFNCEAITPPSRWLLSGFNAQQQWGTLGGDRLKDYLLLT